MSIMKTDEFDINMYTLMLIGAMTFMIFVMGCNPSTENKDSMEEDSVALDEDSLQSEAITVEQDVTDRTIAEYVRKYPDMSYQYVKAEGGNMQSMTGNYKLEVEGINDEQDLEDFVNYVEENYGNRAMKRDRFNKNVEIPAEPQGGLEAYYEELKTNVDFPDGANDEGGTVFVEFVVDEKGEVTRVEATEGLYNSSDQEYANKLESAAEEAVQNTDWKWTPAKQGDDPVKMKLEIPITFQG